MSSTFWVYDSISGEILLKHTGSESSAAMQVMDGRAVITGAPEASSSSHYVNLDGPEPIITSKGDYTLEALPLPCTVTIEGVDYYCTEQPIFEFNYPGVYKIEVDAGVRYLRKEFDFDYQP